mgnify:CR=1 FL=1
MPRTLLLADDSIVIQKLVGLSFANEDVRIVATDNGDDAIARAREVVPDVVLADVVMPGKNGYEVCEAIKQDARLAHIPVLLLTGTFEVFDEARATRAGADGQITKPFEARALVERVSEYMNRPSATPGSDAPNAEATTVAIEDDFFDPNVTTLSPLDASSHPQSDGDQGRNDRAPGVGNRHSESTPAYSGDTSSSSLLFGAPGEGANEDDLEPAIGELVLGQTVSNAEETRVPAEHRLGERAELEPESASTATSATDDFRAFEDDLGLDEPLEFSESLSVSPDDLDEELGASDDDATWLGGLEQPRDADPFSTADSTADSMPDAADRSREAPDRAQTTDRPDIRTAPPMPARDTFAQSPAALDLGPASVASDDLEFGFDVSEQVSGDRLGDSFENARVSSTSETAGDSTGSTPPPARGADRIAAPQRSSASWDTEDILVGYDVSTSDLAGDPGEPAAARTAGSVEVSEPIPASAAFVPTPSLPPQRTHSEADAGPAPSFLSPASPPPPVAPAAPERDASAHADREAAGIDSQDESGNLDLETDLSSGFAAADHADDTIVAEQGWLDSDARSEPIDRDRDPEPGPVPPGIGEAPIHSTPGSTDPEDRRIADLSPLMEQRIQETLEKVAWEAFADLSESIVKQVMGRVEQIAWEVIPQMAETLVREEIRRMKGEEED